MKIFRHILSACMAVAMLSACENDKFYYQDEPRVRLVGDEHLTLGADSLELSFTTYAADEVQVKVDACIMGSVANHDRTVSIEIDEARTTASPTLYSVPPTVTVPAGENKGTFFVTLRNASELQSRAVALYIKTSVSDDFAVGVNEENHLLMRWSDIIVRPLYWADIEEHFGAYSNVKYRFMLDCLVAKGFAATLNPAAGLNWADLHNYNIVFANMLKDYNAAHPGAPLTDENGALVTF